MSLKEYIKELKAEIKAIEGLAKLGDTTWMWLEVLRLDLKEAEARN